MLTNKAMKKKKAITLHEGADYWAEKKDTFWDFVLESVVWLFFAIGNLIKLFLWDFICKILLKEIWLWCWTRISNWLDSFFGKLFATLGILTGITAFIYFLLKYWHFI